MPHYNVDDKAGFCSLFVSTHGCTKSRKSLVFIAGCKFEI
jgi:hypothetical protein